MVQTLKGFYFNAGAFVVINIAVFAISAPTGGLAGGVWWFYWPLIGWGIGLGAHELVVEQKQFPRQGASSPLVNGALSSSNQEIERGET